MNICFLCRNIYKDWGGTETFVLSLSLQLVQAGHRVHILAGDFGAKNIPTPDDRIKIHRVTIKNRPFPGYWRIDRWFPLEDFDYARAVARELDELVAKEKIDIVENMDYFRQGIVYARRKKTAMLTRFHGWLLDRDHVKGNLSFRERLSWYLQQDLIRRMDGLIAVSNYTAEALRDVWNFDGKDIKVIYNAIDTDIFQPPNQNSKEKNILFVGRMMKNKGIQVLAQAIPEILKEFPDTKFYFAGKKFTTMENELLAIEYIQKFTLENKVVFLGEIRNDELVKLYQKSLIFVLPSFYESFGLVALEAMACGCAVVASAVGGLKEIIESEKDGLLVAPGNPYELAEAIKKFLRNENLRNYCVNNAVRKVQEKFSFKRLVRETLDAYALAIERFRTEKN